MSNNWTPELEQFLAALWAQNYTSGEIGLRLGITRSAVLGKVHRLQLSSRVHEDRAPVKSSADRKRNRQFKFAARKIAHRRAA